MSILCVYLISHNAYVAVIVPVQSVTNGIHYLQHSYSRMFFTVSLLTSLAPTCMYACACDLGSRAAHQEIELSPIATV